MLGPLIYSIWGVLVMHFCGFQDQAMSLLLKLKSSLQIWNFFLLSAQSAVRGKKLTPKWHKVTQTKVLIQRSLYKKLRLPHFTVRSSIFAYYTLLPLPLVTGLGKTVLYAFQLPITLYPGPTLMHHFILSPSFISLKLSTWDPCWRRECASIQARV